MVVATPYTYTFTFTYSYYIYVLDNFNLNIIKLLTYKYKLILFKNNSNYSLFKCILNYSTYVILYFFYYKLVLNT